MSDDWEDSSYFDEIYEQASKEAVASFTGERLCSYYNKEPKVAEKPFKSLAEARLLLQTPHCTAAFLHAAVATEVVLKGVVLKPFIYGFIHSDTMAPLIVELAFGSSGFERIKKLLAKVFQDVCALDLMTFIRKGGKDLLWAEIIAVQKQRDHIAHRAEFVDKGDAEKAVAVAGAVVEELFPALATGLGFHLHDGFRLCREWICTQPPHLQKILSEINHRDASKQK